MLCLNIVDTHIRERTGSSLHTQFPCSSFSSSSSSLDCAAASEKDAEKIGEMPYDLVPKCGFCFHRIPFCISSMISEHPVCHVLRSPKSLSGNPSHGAGRKQSECCLLPATIIMSSAYTTKVIRKFFHFGSFKRGRGVQTSSIRNRWLGGLRSGDQGKFQHHSVSARIRTSSTALGCRKPPHTLQASAGTRWCQA